MKFNLTGVENRNTPHATYSYTSEDGQVVVQFKAGKVPWTFELGLATNSAGEQVAKLVIAEFMRVCRLALAKHLGNSEALIAAWDEVTKTLEIKETEA